MSCNFLLNTIVSHNFISKNGCFFSYIFGALITLAIRVIRRPIRYIITKRVARFNFNYENLFIYIVWLFIFPGIPSSHYDDFYAYLYAVL